MAGIALSGWKRLAGKTAAMATALEGLRAQRFVGTVVWYAHFSEYGAEGQPPTRWFRNALREASAQFSAGSVVKGRNMESILKAPESAVIEALAERVQKLAKRNIRQADLIESGDLERSIEVGKSVSDLSSKSKAQVRNPGNF